MGKIRIYDTEGVEQSFDSKLIVKATQTTLATASETVTVAELLTRVLDCTPTSGAATYTLPTAALLVNAMPDVAVGDSFLFYVNNKQGITHAATIAAGAGGTADGTLAIATDVIRMFLIIITDITTAAYFVYGLGA